MIIIYEESQIRGIYKALLPGANQDLPRFNNMIRLLIIFLAIMPVSAATAQIPDHRIFVDYAQRSFKEYQDLLSLPNDAHYPEDIEVNIQWCETHFEKRGFSTQRLSTASIPLLLAERRGRKSKSPTVLIYLQIDGQPVDTTHWHQDNPYQATLKRKDDQGKWEPIDWRNLQRSDMHPDWRIFARSASDAKGPVAMFLAALDLMADVKEKQDYHLKVIMDFEEELGSPSLPQAVVEHREALASDMLIIFDGPRHISNQPSLTFGARGIATVTLEVFGPITPQHSGHYGNYAPNPAVRMAQLIASMKDPQGKVTIPGFYQGIELDEEVEQILSAVPDDEEFIKQNLGIAESDKVAATYQQSLQYPSLNVRGLSSGWVGAEARTIIPASAIAEIDVRLVVESDPQRLIKLIRDHIAQQGYHIMDSLPTHEERMKYSHLCRFASRISYQAFRTEYNSRVGIWLDKALTRAFGKPPIKQRTSGGSIPISPFVIELGIPAVTVPTVNRDNNQHSPNENLRVGNYIDGIKTFYAILTEPLK